MDSTKEGRGGEGMGKARQGKTKIRPEQIRSEQSRAGIEIFKMRVLCYQGTVVHQLL
jgi:hypothetical protein